VSVVGLRSRKVCSTTDWLGMARPALRPRLAAERLPRPSAVGSSVNGPYCKAQQRQRSHASKPENAGVQPDRAAQVWRIGARTNSDARSQGFIHTQ